MKKTCLVILSVVFVSSTAFFAAGKTLQPVGAYAGVLDGSPDQSSQAKKFQVTPEFSEAENVVESLTGTPASDPDSQAKLLQVRALFQAAADANPEATLPLNYLARTYSFPGQDMALGITIFEKSLALDANQPDAITRLVELCLKAGKRPKAEEIQAKFVDRAAKPDLALKVDRVFANFDGKEAQRLIKDGRYQEGTALFDKAIKECADISVQDRLRTMQKDTTREWEINQFNDAVTKVNAKDYKGAWAIDRKSVV